MDGITPAIVRYAADIDATRRFYETLGLGFVPEKHGDGPAHYACALESIVFEIYPLKDGTKAVPGNLVALIFYVPDFEAVVAGMKAMNLKPGTVSVYDQERNLRAVSVRDPDGMPTRLLERDPLVVQ